jgi:hypothetical protein
VYTQTVVLLLVDTCCTGARLTALTRGSCCELLLLLLLLLPDLLLLLPPMIQLMTGSPSTIGKPLLHTTQAYSIHVRHVSISTIVQLMVIMHQASDVSWRALDVYDITIKRDPGARDGANAD